MQFLRSQICVCVCVCVCVCTQRYTHVLQYRDAGRAKEVRKLGEQGMPHAKEIYPSAEGLPAVAHKFLDYRSNFGWHVITRTRRS